jgi:nucleoside-diphosphate-sugar epimerase
MKRIAIVGASGQVGATMVETLLERPGVEVRPFIHTSGSAWRLTRRPIKLETLDILDKDATTAALRGCTHVVNCSRGGGDVMSTGLRNLLAAARKAGVRRFVHISSVAVYGDPPHPDSTIESAPTAPQRGSYGWTKLQQDNLVRAAARQGLSSVSLCPPNITGPYSQFLVQLANGLTTGAFALLDEKDCAINLVDVRNLVHAIELALDKGPSDGSRLFITDDEQTTWADVIDRLLRTLDRTADGFPTIGREELARMRTSAAAARPSITRSLRHLVSSDVREALRADPLLARLEDAAKSLVATSGAGLETRLRHMVEGPVRVEPVGIRDHLNVDLCAQQLRGVRHACAAARQDLGYQPTCTFDQSMRAFSRWFRTTLGMDNEAWPLVRQIA